MRNGDDYYVPIINLTNHKLTNVVVNLATEFESLVHHVGNTVELEVLEDFHNFLLTSANTITHTKKHLQHTGQHVEFALGSIGESRHHTGVDPE